MQNILIPIKINGERRRWNGSALSAASGGQPSATQRDIITHLWLKEISLDFLEIFWWQCLFWQTKQPFPHTCGSENVNISIWTFLEYFEWRKKTALCCPQTRGTLPPQAVLHGFAYCETGGAKLSPFLWQCGHEMCKWEPVFNIYI